MWAVKVNILLVVALLALLHCILIEWILNQRIKSCFLKKKSLCVIVQSNSQKLFIHACSQYLQIKNNKKT